jgi:ABC-2 type transport system permease protein
MMRSPGQLWRVFMFLSAKGMRERMQYKASFLLTVLFRTLSTAMDFVLIAVILARFRYIDGWSVFEVALLYGPVTIARGLFDTFARELERFENYLVSGEYDGILVRPWPSVFALLARKVDVTRVGMLLQGVVLIAIGAAQAIPAGRLSVAGLAYLAVLLPVFGAMILTAVSMATAAIGFWIIRIDELTTFTMYAPLAAGVFPLSIYPGWLRGLLHTVIPIAFAGYLPVLYLLDKGGSGWIMIATPAVALLSLYLASRLWALGERQYHSTGS